MRIEEIINRLEHFFETYCAGAAGTWVEGKWAEAAEAAVALLRTHPDAQPNEPLTLEELREMDGRPVYLPGGECWALVGNNSFCPVFVWKGGECAAADWYEQVGPAYHHPPKEEK